MIKKSYKNTDGTSFHGATIHAKLRDLIDTFGPAHNHQSDTRDKVQNSWNLELEDGTLFTLYDWKEYRAYDIDEIIEWHIGGHNSEDTTKALNALLIGSHE